MKSKKIIVALCAVAVMIASAGGLTLDRVGLLGTAVAASAADLESDGSETNPYLINSADDWNALADSNDSFTDKCFKLCSDISVTTAVGVNTPFSGIFDGNGHTLTVNLNSSSGGIAPFKNTNGSTIKNLKVEGTVKGGRHSAGLVLSPNNSPLVIENVIVNVNVSGSDYLGGIIGHSGNSTVTLDNCVYGGKITATSTGYAGGLIGWSGYTTATISNCAFCGSFTGKQLNPIGFSYKSQGSAILKNIYVTVSSFSTQHIFKYTGRDTELTKITDLSVSSPTAKSELICDGTDLEILNEGSTNLGTMEYSLDGTNYSESTPIVNSGGTYKVWYRVVYNGTVVYEKSINNINVTQVDPTYTVTWLNEDGTTLKTDTVAYGETPVYSGETPTKASNSEHFYTFSGWLPEVTSVTADITYTAQFATNDPAYFVTIPAAVQIGSTATITVKDVVLGDDQSIKVTLDFASNTDSGCVFHAKNGDSVVTYKINDGEIGVDEDNKTVAMFTEAGSAELSFAVESTEGIKYAGEHSETLTFGVAVET